MKDDETVIAIDTNYLLSILRLEPNVAMKYINALEKNKDKIYIPYFVGLEFSFNKSSVKIEKNDKLKHIDDKLDKIKNQLHETSTKISKLTNSNKLNDMLKISDNYVKKFKNLIDDHSSIEKRQKEIYLKLLDIIDDLLGEKPDQDFIDDVEKQGKERYEEGIPPGFDDDSKEGVRYFDSLKYHQKYGDLLIWSEILEYFSYNNEDKKRLIYITDDGISDKKNDLFYKYKEKTVGPRIYLIDEANKRTNLDLYIVDSKSFVLYSDVSLDKFDEDQINSLLYNKKHYKNLNLFNDDSDDFNDDSDEKRSKINHVIHRAIRFSLMRSNNNISNIMMLVLRTSKRLSFLYEQCNNFDRRYLIFKYSRFLMRVYKRYVKESDQNLFLERFRFNIDPLYLVASIEHRGMLLSLHSNMVNFLYDDKDEY